MTASSKNSGLIKGTSSDVTFLAFKYLEIVSLPPSSKPFDLSQNITRMSYFENILEASVTMEIEVASSTSVFNTVNIRGGETVMMEPSYPLVLDATGDKLFVGTGNVTGTAATHMNFIVTGDQES